YTTSTVTSKVTPLPKTVPSAPPFTDANPTKRVVPPVSLAEAAEIASLHRRSKKPRPHLSRTTRTERSDPRTVTEQVTCRTSDAVGNLSPVTPDTASDIAGQRPLPKSEGVIGSGRRPLSRSRYEDSEQMEHASQPRSGVSRASVAGTSHQGTSSHHGSGYFSNMPAPARPLSDVQIGGVSATPPTAESDLEPADPSLSSSGEQPHRLPLSSINTGSQLDASLPSPSLSPITAAANLARNTGYTGLFGGDDDYDDTTDISTLDASQDKLDDGNSGSFDLQDGMLQLKHMQTRHKIGTPPNEARHGKPQLSTPTLMEIPTMIDAFDAMPMEMQTYFMYQMLRRCAKPTLHFVADVVNPTLKCDFLGVLPLELSQIVIRNLDAQSMCRAAQVSK
ncbi:SCF ubiquitin ligase complex subunit cdc4, partial [Cryomyces antarcticus]